MKILLLILTSVILFSCDSEISTLQESNKELSRHSIESVTKALHSGVHVQKESLKNRDLCRFKKDEQIFLEILNEVDLIANQLSMMKIERNTDTIHVRLKQHFINLDSIVHSNRDVLGLNEHQVSWLTEYKIEISNEYFPKRNSTRLIQLLTVVEETSLSIMNRTSPFRWESGFIELFPEKISLSPHQSRDSVFIDALFTRNICDPLTGFFTICGKQVKVSTREIKIACLKSIVREGPLVWELNTINKNTDKDFTNHGEWASAVSWF